MKTINKICWILAVVCGLGALVLFFLPFASVTTGTATANPVGAALVFGAKIDVAGTSYDLGVSTKLLFCFLMSLLTTVFAILSFKKKGVRYATPVAGLIVAIFMLVVRLSSAGKFVDSRPLPLVSKVAYTGNVWLIVIALFACVVFAIAYLFIDDYLEVLASNGEKKTIAQRFFLLIRDYKSEIKKIVWPGFKEVAKNTLIVIIMCLLLGILIWAVDYGLGQLLELILK